MEEWIAERQDRGETPSSDEPRQAKTVLKMTPEMAGDGEAEKPEREDKMKQTMPETK
jgi:hypothetical protein